MKTYSRVMAGLAFAAGLAGALSASAQTNLVTNGNFGAGAYPDGSTPTSYAWIKSNNGNLQLSTQAIPYGCTQFNCGGRISLVWACISGSSTVSLENTWMAGELKPSTRYRVSFDAFKDIKSLSSNSPSRTQEGTLVVTVNGTQDANYATKDLLTTPIEMGKYSILNNRPQSFEFVTPVNTSPSNVNNIAPPQLRFSVNGSLATNANAPLCITRVRMEEVAEPATNNKRVVVNTYGYPALGSKVATLVLPEGTNIQGYKWRLRYGSGYPKSNYSVGVNFYAVVTDANGLPVKGTNSKYQLQQNSYGEYVIVGGTGTGGQSNYFPANGTITTGALKQDPDSGDWTYALDFSDFGVPVTRPMSIPDGSGTPSQYTKNGNIYYILSGSSYNAQTYINESPGSLKYRIEVLDQNNKVVVTSPLFSVNKAPYDALKKDALYTFYHQRSNQAITPFPGIGEKAENTPRQHAAGHANETAQCFSGKDLHGNDWGSASNLPWSCQDIDVSGGWYDAADHGKYVVNGGLTLWTLQNKIERLQKQGALAQAFPAGGMNLPVTYNTGGSIINNLSDLMAEARVEMEWMMKMQVPAGTYMRVPVGNQALKQQPDNGKWGQDSANSGVFQIKLKPTSWPDGNGTISILKETAVAPSEPGDIDFAGGQLPRLRLKLNLTEEDVGDMVFHSVHDSRWTGIPLNPASYHTDSQSYGDQANPRVVMYPTTAATLNFAAVAAQCSRIWQSIDPVFAQQCLNKGRKAWAAARSFASRGNILRYEYTNTSNVLNNTASGSWKTADLIEGKEGKNASILNYGFALNPMFSGGGAYGDLRVGDEFLWAAKELTLADGISYSTSGLTGDCSANSLQCYNWVSGYDWQNVSPLGHISEWTSRGDTTAAGKIRAAANTLANFATPGQSTAQGYLFAKQRYAASDRNTNAEWGDNGAVLNRSLILLLAHEVSSKKSGWQADAPKYLNAAVNSLGYLLGRNHLSKSYISGYGSNDFSNAHHRWFAKAADASAPSLPKGYVAGGPNTRDLPALRANASRYSYEDMVQWVTQYQVQPTRAKVGWEVGDINDQGQEYLETHIVPYCTTGLGAANPGWSVPASVGSATISYTPQKCYRDDYRSFATNEIAINWQAPLVWVSQYLSEIYQ